MGRPRKRPAGETVTLSFRAEPRLVEALDHEAERISAEQPAGRAKVSRTELVKIALFEWIEQRAKSRGDK